MTVATSWKGNVLTEAVLGMLLIVVWVATCGRGTLIGANAARSLLTAQYPEW
jgi:hypothetical protein